MNVTETKRCIKKIDPMYKIDDTEKSQPKRRFMYTTWILPRQWFPVHVQDFLGKRKHNPSKKGVSSAPGPNKVKVVLSLTNPKTPHSVTGNQGWKAMKCKWKG